jgi:hypothetical protein
MHLPGVHHGAPPGGHAASHRGPIGLAHAIPHPAGVAPLPTSAAPWSHEADPTSVEATIGHAGHTGNSFLKPSMRPRHSVVPPGALRVIPALRFDAKLQASDGTFVRTCTVFVVGRSTP